LFNYLNSNGKNFKVSLEVKKGVFDTSEINLNINLDRTGYNYNIIYLIENSNLYNVSINWNGFNYIGDNLIFKNCIIYQLNSNCQSDYLIIENCMIENLYEYSNSVLV